MRTRRTGFTLIELLVVIAIIAILAAMLFPVFARARESARKIQCLANVKNIAIGVQMYLSDYDRFPPGFHDSEAQAWADTGPGRGRPREDCWRIVWANPHLRWQVVFDEYVKNRDVWRCPSQKLAIPSNMFIVPDYDGAWWKYLRNHEGEWGTGMVVSPCAYAFPPGWGGSVTDSVAQQQLGMSQASGWITGMGAATGAVEIGIGTGDNDSADVKTSQIEDPSWYVVCGDVMDFPTMHNALKPLYEICGQTCGFDWANCPQSQTCSYPSEDFTKFFSDPTYRAKYTRHLGGSNFGFADGHAAWSNADAFRANLQCEIDCIAGSCRVNPNGKLRGICPP